MPTESLPCHFYGRVRVRSAGDGYIRRWTGKCDWCGRYVLAEFVSEAGGGYTGSLVAHTQSEPNWAVPFQYATRR